MEYMELEVYSQSINRGVVKMPSQHFPGLVVQGETLSTLTKLARAVNEKSQQTANTELIDISHELMDSLQIFPHLLVFQCYHYQITILMDLFHLCLLA